MRGVPGSGKSTAAKKILDSHVAEGLKCQVCSTDFYFMKDGTYQFDPQNLGRNHMKNQDRAWRLMREGCDVVIIDNTNIRARDYSPYVKLAKSHGYEVEFREPESEWWEDYRKGEITKELLAKVCSEVNTHGVPEDAILRMIETWERVG